MDDHKGRVVFKVVVLQFAFVGASEAKGPDPPADRVDYGSGCGCRHSDTATHHAENLVDVDMHEPIAGGGITEVDLACNLHHSCHRKRARHTLAREEIVGHLLRIARVGDKLRRELLERAEEDHHVGVVDERDIPLTDDLGVRPLVEADELMQRERAVVEAA